MTNVYGANALESWKISHLLWEEEDVNFMEGLQDDIFGEPGKSRKSRRSRKRKEKLQWKQEQEVSLRDDASHDGI